MKDIIYFDAMAINSLLAQAGSGLIGKLVTQVQTNLSESETATSSNEVSGGVSAHFLKGSAHQNIGKSFETTYTKTNSDIEEVAFHDYALDILIDHLNESTDNFRNSNFIFIEDKARYFDFSRLEKIMDEDIVSIYDQTKKENRKIRDEINTLKREKNSRNKQQIDKKIKNLEDSLIDEKSSNNFRHVHDFGKFGNALFPDSILAKISDYISVCPKENLRINDASIMFYNEIDKLAKCLAIKIYQRGEGYIKKDADGNVIQLESEVIAASAPTMFTDILLDNFKLSKKDDYIVKPIAIFYDID